MVLPFIQNELSLTTPAVLFSAVSLIMLAYTNRFLAYTKLIRELKDRYDINKDVNLAEQIITLQKRVRLTRRMQVTGTGSLFVCVLTMFIIYLGMNLLALYLFAISLILLILSLGLSVWEIFISSRSIDLHLHDFEK